MSKKIIITLLLIVACLLANHAVVGRKIKKHKCMHDEIMKNFQPKDLEVQEGAQRILQTTTAAPIRITTNYTNLTSFLVNDQNMANYLIKIVDTSKKFFEDSLTVIPYPYAILLQSGASCLSHAIPSDDPIVTSPGINNTDIHFYITITDEPTNSFLAYAGSCYFRSGLRKTPIIGRINFNYAYLKGVNTTDSGEFQEQLETAIHEFTHAFGFSGSHIQNNFWYNKTNNSQIQMNQILIPNVTIRGYLTHLLTSPNVMKVARQYYNCSNIQGMQLENQGGSGSLGSHWERVILQNEIMTASAISTDSAYSAFTIALLQDTGYYESVREQPFDQMVWGKNRGCNFVTLACNDTVQSYPEFCTDAQASAQQKSCNFEGSGIGYCRSSDTYADKCPYVSPYSNSYCKNTTNITGMLRKSYSYYGMDSMCFRSSIVQSGWTYSIDFDCLKAECVNGNQINITIENKYYICSQPGQILQAQSGHGGNLTCPSDFSVICNQMFPCPNFCSSNGYCLGKQCFCNSQFAGEDCSTSCANVMYNGQCVSSCPANYYTKNSSKVCLQCNGACATCFDQFNTTCLSCNTNYFLENTTCGLQCSSNLFKSLTLKKCVANCFVAEQKYGDKQQQTCVAQCPSGFTGNQTSGNCECPGFIFNLTCVTQCPVGYYQNNITKTCVQCHSNCATCYAGLNSNCSSCVSNYFLDGNTCDIGCPGFLFKKLSANKCVNASTCYTSGQQYADTITQSCVSNCPTNFVANNVTGNCDTSCATPGTFYDASINNCTTNCSVGFFGDSISKTCVQVCPANYTGNSTTRLCELVCQSGQYKNLTSKLCQTTCAAGFFGDNVTKTCAQSCTPGTFGNTVTHMCVANCTGSYIADSLSKQCVLQCPQNYFNDTVNKICVSKCPTPLLSYTQKCLTSCPSGIFNDIISSSCVGTCPNNTINNTNLMKCIPSCSSSQFFDATNNSCVSQCSTGLYGDPTTVMCVQTCPPNYNADINTRQCTLSTCQTNQFRDPTTNSCVQKCSAGLFGDQVALTCVQLCPNGTFADNVTAICVNTCPAGRFQDSLNRVCTSKCPSGFVGDVFTNLCSQNCSAQAIAAGYFADFQTANCSQSCSNNQLIDIQQNRCVSSCATGTFNDSNICVGTCSAGFFGDSVSKRCVLKCPINYFGDRINRTCVANCSSTLFTDLPNGLCVQGCNTTTQFVLLSNKTCFNVCPSNLYSDILARSCVANCPQNTIVTNNKQCVAPCTGGQYFDFSRNQCETICWYDTYGDNATWTCVQNCSGIQLRDPMTQQCTYQCFGDQFGLNSTKECVYSCPAPMYSNAFNRFCTLSCPSPLVHDFPTKSCQQECQPNQFFNSTNRTCALGCNVLADIATRACVNACPSGTQQLGKLCIPQCSPGKVFNFTSKSCIDCNTIVSGCSACSLTSNSTLLSQTVQCQACQAGFYRNLTANQCQSCSLKVSGCLNCRFNQNISNTTVECLDCGQNLAFNYTNSNFTCQPCSSFFSGCQQCGTAINVTTLKPFTQCLQCGNMQLFNASSRACESCQQFIPGCLGCQSLTNNSNSIFCYDCGYGRYYNATSRQCLSCNDTIKDCVNCRQNQTTNKVECLSCSSTYKSYNPLNNSCDLCTIQTRCDKCAFNQLGEQFCAQCQYGYIFNRTSKVCELCTQKISGCQQCKEDTSVNPAKIVCLSCPYTLFLNTTSSTCNRCSQYIPDCLQCTFTPNTLTCFDCGFAKYFNASSGQCLSCANVTPGCKKCTPTATCTECEYGKYYNSTTKTCQICSNKVASCLSCTQNLANPQKIDCSYCDYKKAFNATLQQCVNCDSLIADCQVCSISPINNQAVCQYCNYGQFAKNSVCMTCNSEISGCLGCYQSNTPSNVQELYCSDCRGLLGGNNSSLGSQAIGSEGTYYSLSSKSCKKCSDRVKGCIGCSENYRWATATPATPEIDFSCWNCGVGNYYNNYTSACESCAAITQNCVGCYYDFYTKKRPVCSQCIVGMYYDLNFEQCISCENGFPGCQNCYGWLNYQTQKIVVDCQQCLPGFAMDYVNKKCVKTYSCQDNCDRCSILNTTVQNYIVTLITVDPNNPQNINQTNVTKQKTIVNTKCEVCVEGFVLSQDQSKCIFDQDCNEGRYFDGVSCQYCYKAIGGCYTCNRKSGANVTCTACFNSFLLSSVSGLCEVSANQLNCPAGCSNCDYDTTLAIVQCTACSENYKLNLVSKRCELDCVSLGLNNCDKCQKIFSANNSQIQCDRCWTNFALSADRKCNLIQKCNESQTFYQNNGSCVQCPSNCLGCKDVSLTGEAMKLKCDFCAFGFAPSPDFAICNKVSNMTLQQYCPEHCSDCQYKASVNALNCTSCRSPYVQVSANLKLLQNQINYDVYSDLYRCGVSCTSPCQECDWNAKLTQKICKVCFQNYLLNSYGNCIYQRSCALGQFFDPNQFQTDDVSLSGSCTNCPVFCSSCIYSEFYASVFCNSCKDGYKLNLLGQCIQKLQLNESSCPVGQFMNQTSLICQHCPANCAVCSFDVNLSKMLCTTCLKGFVPSKLDGCVLNSTCPSGQYWKPSVSSSGTSNTGSTTTLPSTSTASSSGQCLACSANCVQCYFDKADLLDKCTTCADDFFLTAKGLCVSKVCKDAFVFNPDFGCEACPNFCNKCTRPAIGGRLVCLQGQCSVGYKHNATSGQCYFDTQYCQQIGQVAMEGQCRPCPYNCTKCSLVGASDIQCTTCQSSFALQNNRCVYTLCKAAQYYGLSFTNWTMGCYDCPAGCGKCNFNHINQKIQCTECLVNYTLSAADQWCNLNPAASKPVCLANQTLMEDKVRGLFCQNCPEQCKTCYFKSNKMLCLSCATGFFLNTTYYKCTPNTTLLPTVNCTAQQISQQAQQITPQAYSFTQKVCKDCPPGCSECRQSFLEDFPFLACSKCNSGFTWYTDWKCYKSCPQGQLAFFYTDTTNGTQLQSCRACLANCLMCDLDYTVSPPKELCYRCADGFFQKFGQCQAYPECQTNQYLTLTQNTTALLTLNAECRQCPAGCLTCKNTSPTFSGNAKIECIECNTTTHIKSSTSGLCVVSNYNNKDQVDCGNPETSALFKYFQPSLNKWVCGQCPTGCISCLNTQKCLVCTANLYFLSKNSTCVLVPNCTSTNNKFQYFSLSLNQCTDCPQTCNECLLKDLYNEASSLVCKSCPANFELTESGSCVKNLLSDPTRNITNADFCASDSTTYAILIDGAVQCLPCPSNCASCQLENARVSTSHLRCTACKASFALFNNDQCKSICANGEYWSVNQCLACHYACKDCLDGTDKCLTCAQNYETTSASNGSCLEKPSHNNNGISNGNSNNNNNNNQDNSLTGSSQDCGVSAYYDSIADACVCTQAGMFFSEKTKNCSSVSDYAMVCSIGQYLEGSTTCLPCMSADDQGRCAVCQGPTAADCLQCVSGFFLEASTQNCVACGTGCTECSSQTMCSKCDAGFYRYTEILSGQTVTKCYAQCPTGTLPYLVSLYYLNEELFSAEERQKYLSQSEVEQQSADNAASQTVAIALNVNYEPVFDNLPWDFDAATGEPTYLDQKIRLECVPCRDHCTGCISSQLFIPAKSICYEGDYCPDDYIIDDSVDAITNNKRQCILPPPDSFKTSFIDRPTLALESGIQPLQKNLFIEINTTLDNTTKGVITYQWSLLDVKQDVVGLKKANPKQQYSETIASQKQQQLKTKLFQQVNLNQKTLNIQSKNLQQFVTYSLQVEAKLKYNAPSNRVDSLLEKINITVRNIPSFRQVQDLGVTNDLITVDPQSGISGVTKFKAKYSICNAPAYTKPALSSGTWKFLVEVINNRTSANSFTLQSGLCSDFLEFTIPPQKLGDYFYNVQFTFSFGENFYQTTRKIKVLANPQFTLKNDSTILKLSSNTTTTVVTQNDLAIGASLLHNEISTNKLACPSADAIMASSFYATQGPCNMTDSTPCCGQGICIQSISGTQYQCRCKSGYQGIFCNIPQTVTDSIKDLVGKLVNLLKSQKIDLKNVDSIIQTINKVVKSQTLDAAMVKSLQEQLNLASTFIKDTKTLNLLLDTISEIQKGQSIDGVTTNKTQSYNQQTQNLKTITQAVQSAANQLSKANPENSFSAGGVTGKNQLISSSDITSNKIQVQMPSNNKNSSLNVGINKSVIGNLASVTLSTIVSSKNLINTAVGGNQLISDNLEISLIDPKNGTKLQIKNLTGICPISFTMTVQPKNTQKVNSTLKCTYFDATTNAYSSEGCNTTDVSKVTNTTYKITCCCNHMSWYGVSEPEEQQLSLPNTQTEYMDEVVDGVIIRGSLLLLFSLLIALLAI